jgi:DASH complex subunit DAD1
LPASQVGNEFSSVEALWSQFEGVMAKDTEDGKGDLEGAEKVEEDSQVDEQGEDHTQVEKREGRE